MAETLYLNPTTWDLDVDANGNIAVATGPYALAQDAASAVRTFAGECYYDTTLGVDHLGEILGHAPPLSLLKSRLEAAALTVDGVEKAQLFVTAVAARAVQGQVQISDASGATAAVSF